MRIIPCIATLSLLTLSSLVFAVYDNDSTETRELLKRAAQEDGVAMEKLGDLYRQGASGGVKADKTEAIIWYAHAVQAGNAAAADKLWSLEHGGAPPPASTAVDDQATQDLCKYLYYTSLAADAVVQADELPKGINGRPTQMKGNVFVPAYSANVVKKYLAQGADPRAAIPTEKLGIPDNTLTIRPLVYVAKKKDYKTMDLLIQKGACVHDADMELLLVALQHLRGDEGAKDKSTAKTLQYLAAHGADWGVRDLDGQTLLMRCASLANNKAISFLLEKGCDVNAEAESRYIFTKDAEKAAELLQDTAFMQAARGKYVNSVELLLKAGADINHVRNGQTALDEAEAKLKKGEQVSTSKSYEEELARLKAISYSGKKPTKVSKKNADPVGAPRFNLVQLLRLAGAKKATQLHQK